MFVLSLSWRKRDGFEHQNGSQGGFFRTSGARSPARPGHNISLCLSLSPTLPMCLSRACLGKRSVFSSIKRRSKGVFSAPPHRIRSSPRRPGDRCSCSRCSNEQYIVRFFLSGPVVCPEPVLVYKNDHFHDKVNPKATDFEVVGLPGAKRCLDMQALLCAGTPVPVPFERPFRLPRLEQLLHHVHTHTATCAGR